MSWVAKVGRAMQMLVVACGTTGASVCVAAVLNVVCACACTWHAFGDFGQCDISPCCVMDSVEGATFSPFQVCRACNHVACVPEVFSRGSRVGIVTDNASQGDREGWLLRHILEPNESILRLVSRGEEREGNAGLRRGQAGEEDQDLASHLGFMRQSRARMAQHLLVGSPVCL